MELPEVTGSDVTGSQVTGKDVARNDVSHVTRSMFYACATVTMFFLTIVVVQNVPLRMTGSSMAIECDVIKRHVTLKQFPWKGEVCACATGSCAISALLGPIHRK